MKRRRFDEGGDISTGLRGGDNANIGDDVRARALAWAARGGDESPPAPKAKAKAKATPAPITAPTTAPESKRGGTSPDDIPGSDYKLREGRGSPIENDSTLMRNVKNTATALSPFGIGAGARAAAGLASAGKAGVAAGRAVRARVASIDAAKKARMDRYANIVKENPIADYSGLAEGVGYAMKKGGAVKAFAKGGKVDGIAKRGKTRGRVC